MYLPKKSNVDAAWDGVLCVPFEQKDAVKALGAVWDATRRTWVVPPALRPRRSEFRAWDKHKQALPADVSDELKKQRVNITHEIARALRAAPP
jgi:hypothetical protein